MREKQGLKQKTEVSASLNRNRLLHACAIFFWIIVWQILSMQGKLGLFIASPLKTAQTFIGLVQTARFWKSILYTTGRIMGGFLPAILLATGLSILTLKYQWIDILLMPAMRFIRTVPVVSFIILALIMFSSRYLTQLISMTMALPVVYMNLKTGIRQTDSELVEMAVMYAVPRFYIYVL